MWKGPYDAPWLQQTKPPLPSWQLRIAPQPGFTRPAWRLIGGVAGSYEEAEGQEHHQHPKHAHDCLRTGQSQGRGYTNKRLQKQGHETSVFPFRFAS